MNTIRSCIKQNGECEIIGGPEAMNTGAESQTKPLKGKAGGSSCAVPSPDEHLTPITPRLERGFYCPRAMTAPASA